MSKQPKTAAELIAELQSDASYCARRNQKDRHRLAREQQYSKLLAPLLQSLSSVGLTGNSLEEIVQKYTPLPVSAVPILLSAIPETGDLRVKESIVRALGAASQPFDGRPLTKCFDQASDESLRWAILNTISVARPHSIDTWLLGLRDTHWGKTLRELSRGG